jgi:mannosyltransferase OCH1-like enzyme
LIEKKIHYCWFGDNPKPKIFQDCFSSWKKQCSNYEIIEWNELNTVQYQNKFFKNALRKKKYAFVADYIRIKVLHEFGGIYLDTDMLLLKPIDDLLVSDFFIGEEVKGRVAYGIFGASKSHRFFNQMLNFYENNEFDAFSPPIITHLFGSLINENTLFKNEIIYAPTVFYPLTFQNRNKDYTNYLTENSYAVHLWNHSWKNKSNKRLTKSFNKIKEITIDYIFFNYPFKYFKKYLMIFLKEIYHLVKN